MEFTPILQPISVDLFQTHLITIKIKKHEKAILVHH